MQRHRLPEIASRTARSLGRRIALEQRVHRHDEPRRAEAALHRAGLDERALHVGQRAAFVGLQPLDGHDLGADRRRREHEARAHEHAVDEHRTRTALALLATGLGAGEAEPLAQHVEQALAEPRVGDARARLPLTRRTYTSFISLTRCTSAARGGPCTSTAWRRYSAVPRWSSIGRAAAATRGAELATVVVGLDGEPVVAPASPGSRSTRTASGAASGVGPTEPSPMPTDRASRSTAIASDATAITIALRTPTFR